MNYVDYLPFAVNLGFLGVGYWAGTRGPAKVWQDLTGDVADIKNRIESLNAKITPTVTVTNPAPTTSPVLPHPVGQAPVVAPVVAAV